MKLFKDKKKDKNIVIKFGKDDVRVYPKETLLVSNLKHEEWWIFKDINCFNSICSNDVKFKIFDRNFGKLFLIVKFDKTRSKETIWKLK